MTDAHCLLPDIQKIRFEAPLVNNITNYHVTNSTAGALPAIGASPVMAHAIDEVEEMAGIVRALVINIWTELIVCTDRKKHSKLRASFPDGTACAVSVSGVVDVIVEGETTISVSNGHP